LRRARVPALRAPHSLPQDGVIRRSSATAVVVCSDRLGGVSRAPYDSANLADHVGDDPACVAQNRARLAAAVSEAEPAVPADPALWVWLHQVHGADVALVDGPHEVVPPADAAVTTTPGLPLVVLTADCAPVAL